MCGARLEGGEVFKVGIQPDRLHHSGDDGRAVDAERPEQLLDDDRQRRAGIGGAGKRQRRGDDRGDKAAERFKRSRAENQLYNEGEDDRRAGRNERRKRAGDGRRHAGRQLDDKFFLHDDAVELAHKERGDQRDKEVRRAEQVRVPAPGLGVEIIQHKENGKGYDAGRRAVDAVAVDK